MIHNWQLPLLMTFLAGLATILGGFITFFVNKNNMKVLSLGLGFSAGVMIFVSLTEILHSAPAGRFFPEPHAVVCCSKYRIPGIYSICLSLRI